MISYWVTGLAEGQSQDTTAIIITIHQSYGAPLEDVRLIRSGEVWLVGMPDGSRRRIPADEIVHVFDGENDVTIFFPSLEMKDSAAQNPILVKMSQQSLQKMLLMGAVGSTVGGFTRVLVGGIFIGDGPTGMTKFAVGAIMAGIAGGGAMGVIWGLPPGATVVQKKKVFFMAAGAHIFNFTIGLLVPSLFSPITGIVAAAVIPYFYYRTAIE